MRIFDSIREECFYIERARITPTRLLLVTTRTGGRGNVDCLREQGKTARRIVVAVEVRRDIMTAAGMCDNRDNLDDLCSTPAVSRRMRRMKYAHSKWREPRLVAISLRNPGTNHPARTNSRARGRRVMCSSRARLARSLSNCQDPDIGSMPSIAYRSNALLASGSS
jgi:hypothetical protein